MKQAKCGLPTKTGQYMKYTMKKSSQFKFVTHKETGIFDMQRRMACVQGMVYPPRARHGCTQWLHKPQLFVEGQVFQHKPQVQLSSTQPHLEQPPWRWPKDVPLRMKTM